MTRALPEGWEWAQVPDVTENCDSRRVPLNSREREGRAGPYPYFGANGQVGTIDDYLFDGSYILVAEDGGYFDDPTRNVAYLASGRFWVNNHAHVLRPLGVIDPRLIRDALNRVRWADHISGTTRAKLTQGSLNEVQVPVPPLAEQRRIVEKIEALTARSGRAREALAALPALLDRYRAAVLTAAFRGDLTAEWREEHPHAQTADKFLARLGVPVEDIDADEVPLTLPPTWRWARIASLTEVKGGLAKGKKRKATDRLEMIPYLRVANVQRGYLDLTQVKEIEATPEEIAPLLLQPGDILFNEGGDRDKLGRGWVWNGEVERCIHQNHVFRARPISVEINPYLISHFANTYGQRYFFGEGKQSVNLASISLSKLRAFPVPVIPPAEQVVLMQRLQQAFLHVDAFEAAWRAASNRLPTLDSAILAKAFRGELVPQDPTDEPASALLERIRAARAAVGDRPRGGRRWKEPA